VLWTCKCSVENLHFIGTVVPCMGIISWSVSYGNCINAFLCMEIISEIALEPQFPLQYRLSIPKLSILQTLYKAHANCPRICCLFGESIGCCLTSHHNNAFNWTISIGDNSDSTRDHVSTDTDSEGSYDIQNLLEAFAALKLDTTVTEEGRCYFLIRMWFRFTHQSGSVRWTHHAECYRNGWWSGYDQ
jgi:hypothetical protein